MQGKVASIRIAYGGMAATPKRASNVEAALVGKPWNEESVEAALEAYGLDYQPLSDMRATADYRLLVAKNLLRRFYAETQGESEPLRKPNVEAA
jgi:xanthine dehydrogenase small subunit